MTRQNRPITKLYLESWLFDSKLSEVFPDVKDESADVVLREVNGAAVKRHQSIDQVVLTLNAAKIRNQLKKNGRNN